MHDVFVSHASADAESANGLVSSLERRGVRCWVAPRDVPPGSEYGQAIVDAIRGSRMVVALVSQAALDSPHVRREVERAVNLGVPTLPVRLEDVTPTGSLEYFLSGAHHVDWLSGPAGNPAHRIAQALTDDDGRPVPPVAPRAGDRSGVPPRAILWGLAALALVAAIFAIAFLIDGEPAASESSTTTSTGAVTTPTQAVTTTALVTTTQPPTTTTSSTPPIPDALRGEASGWPIRLAEPLDDNDRGWFEGTQSDEQGEQTYGLDQGRYVIELDGNEGGGSYYSTIDLVVGSRLMAEVSFTPVDFAEEGACGLALRMVDGRDLFVAVARDTGRGGASLFVDSELNFLLGDVVPISDTGTDLVTVILDETAGYVIVNGEAVGSFDDDRLGDVIAVGPGAQFGDVLRCRFDDLVVRAP